MSIGVARHFQHALRSSGTCHPVRSRRRPLEQPGFLSYKLTRRPARRAPPQTLVAEGVEGRAPRQGLPQSRSGGMADALGSGPSARKGVEVQVLSSALVCQKGFANSFANPFFVGILQANQTHDPTGLPSLTLCPTAESATASLPPCGKSSTPSRRSYISARMTRYRCGPSVSSTGSPWATASRSSEGRFISQSYHPARKRASRRAAVSPPSAKVPRVRRQAL